MKVNISYQNCFYFLVLFFSTLRITSPVGIYFFSLLIPLFMCFVYFIFNYRSLSLSSYGYIISIAVIINWLFFYIIPPEINLIINDKQYILILFFVIFASFFNKNFLMQKKSLNLIKIGGFLIFIHSFVFLVQFFSWYLFHIDIDFGPMTGGSPHRALYYGWLYRATGLFEEPSIYCGYMISFISLRYLLSGRLSLLDYIGLITVGMSFATIGLILAVLILIICNARFDIVKLIVLSICIVLVLTYSIEYLSTRFTLIMNGTDGSTSVKFSVIELYFSEVRNLIFGLGMLYKEKLNTNAYDGLGDLSIYLNSIIIFGFPGLSILFVLFNKIKKLSYRKRMIVLLSFVKMSAFHYPYFWMYYFLIIYLISFYYSFNKEKVCTL